MDSYYWFHIIKERSNYCIIPLQRSVLKCNILAYTRKFNINPTDYYYLTSKISDIRYTGIAFKSPWKQTKTTIKLDLFRINLHI